MTKLIKLASLKRDLVAETNGAWIESIAWPGISYFLRSPETDGFREDQQKIIRDWSKEFGRKPVPQQTQRDRMAVLYLDHLISDWKGLGDENGEITFTRERALEILVNPEYREVVRDIENCANKVGQRTVEFVEDASKNSAASSATTLN